MSKPDLENIITSPEAEVFLQMVTRDFYSNSYIGLWIFEVIGREWDEMRAWAEDLKQEINPQTCTWTLPIWEWVYGIPTDTSLTFEYRRQRLLTKIITAKPINPEVIRRGAAALIGTSPESIIIDPNKGPYQFEITVHTTDKSLPYDRLPPYIYDIKPAHLRVNYNVKADPCKNLYCGLLPQIKGNITVYGKEV